MPADQIAQLAGAGLILAAFVGTQTGRLDARSALSLALNLAGSLLLTAVALAGRDLGFLLLEAVWAGVSAAGLVRLTAARRTGSG